VTRLHCLALYCAALFTVAPATATTGSWSAGATRLHIAVADKLYHSPPFVSSNPAASSGRVMTQVSWRYRLAPGTSVRAWLCAAQRCVDAASQRGHTAAFTGIAAETPLELRFRGRGGVTVEDMRVIVHFR